MATEPGGCRGDVAYLVTYLDHWSWDMRLFLAKLTVEVGDASTGEIVAYGEAKQDSLGAMGTSHREVVDRAVGAVLADR